MKRKTFDKMVTLLGLILAVFLLIMSGLLFWGSSFATDTVANQLKAQAITIPDSNGDPKATAEVVTFFKSNGNKTMSNGKQAQMYADYYIGFHLSKMPTYAAASGTSRAASAAALSDPGNEILAASAAKASATVETVFKGQSLRGMLLNAYAFGTLGMIASIAGKVTLLSALLLFLLVAMGLRHLRVVNEDEVI